MGALSLTVQVLNLSPKATLEDLNTFFSYCGSIDDIQLHWDGAESKTAYVTFKQPYAHQTALLLNDALVVDRRVRIRALETAVDVPIISCTENMKNNEAWKTWGGLQTMGGYAVAAAEHAIRGSSCLSQSAIWLSSMFDRASKVMAELGADGGHKDKDSNSRKKK